MSRYIDADAMKEWLDEYLSVFKKYDKSEVKGFVEHQPSIDIEPKRGEWIDKGWKGDWEFETGGRGNCWREHECSECGFHKKGSKSNFCPNCGASMSEREGE